MKNRENEFTNDKEKHDMMIGYVQQDTQFTS